MEKITLSEGVIVQMMESLTDNGFADIVRNWLKWNGDILMKSGSLIRRVQCAAIDGVNPCPYCDMTVYAL